MNQKLNQILQKIYPYLLVVIGAAGGGVLYAGMKRWGIGVYYDSVFYISAADNLLKGNGLGRLAGDGTIIPLNHYPPLYSILLAGVSGITGWNTTLAAWTVTIVCFSVLIFLTGWCVYGFTRSKIAGIVGALLVLTSPIIADLHLMAMTEPIFLIFALAALMMVEKAVSEPRMKWVLWAALFTSAAYLSRYVGIVLAAAGFLCMILFMRIPFWKRVKLAVPYGILSVLLNLLWAVRNMIETGSATNRLFDYHSIAASKLNELNKALSAWFLPGRIPASMRSVLTVLLILAAVLFSTWLLWKSWKQRNDGTPEIKVIQFSGMLSLFYILYVISVVFSLLFFDASTRLNDRILCPLYFTLLIQLILLVWLEVHKRPVLLRGAAVAAAVLLMMVYALDEYKLLADYTHDGIGFTGRVWQKSETIQQLKQQPVSGAVYSNEAFGLYYLLDKPIFSIPQTRDPVTTEKLPGYQDSIQDMQQNIQKTNGAMVIFTPYDTGGVYPELDEMTRGLTLSLTTADGKIYQAK
jgi:hypothetical protein